MRRLALAAAGLVAVLGLAACNFSSVPSGRTWAHAEPGEVTIWLVTGLDVPSDIRAAVDRAARDWSAAEGVRLRIVNRAQPGAVNVPVVWEPSFTADDGSTWLAFTSTEITAAKVRLGSAFGPGVVAVSPNTFQTGCHEVGHVLGLKHPTTGTGPCSGGHPTGWDLALVSSLYRDG